jgi:hypothetical protein
MVAENCTVCALPKAAGPCWRAARVKVEGKKGVGVIRDPVALYTFTVTVTSTAGRLPKLRLKKLGTTEPSVNTLELV